MRLRRTLRAALCLASLAAMACFLLAYLALSSVGAETALVTGAAGVTLVCLTLAVFAERRFLAPLQTIMRALERVGDGDLTGPPPSDRADEIGDLSRAVSTLAGKLAQTAQDRASEQATISEAADRFFALAHLAADFVWETDARGHVTYVSGKIPTGVEMHQMIGHPLAVLMSVAVPVQDTRPLELTSRRPLEKLLCTYGENEETRGYCRMSGEALLDKTGTFQGYRGIGQDVTADIVAEACAQASAFKDPLTGLANQTLIKERISHALTARAVSGGEVAVLHLNLDGFSRVNDRFGHATGDAALRSVATRLSSVIRPQDTLARLNGDSFALVQATGAQPVAAERLSHALLKALRQPVELEGHSIPVTVSIGCAIATPGDNDPLILLRNADIALARAKDDGRNTYRFHETAMTTALQSRVRLERDLRHAIDAGGIELHYAPVQHATRRDLVGFEAQMRWPRAGYGMVYPEDFLSIAEESGLIIPLTTHMLRTACRTATHWPDLQLSLHLSSGFFREDGLLETVMRSLRDSGLSARRLTLGITEAALSGSEDAALFRLDALRDLGVRLALEEFGAGTASLQTMRRFPFDMLKLDPRFVADVDRDIATTELVRTVVRLGAVLGMETAADGVSHEGQAVQLTKLGCHLLQGPQCGKAVSAPRALSMIRAAGLLPDTPTAEVYH